MTEEKKSAKMTPRRPDRELYVPRHRKEIAPSKTLCKQTVGRNKTGRSSLEKKLKKEDEPCEDSSLSNCTKSNLSQESCGTDGDGQKVQTENNCKDSKEKQGRVVKRKKTRLKRDARIVTSNKIPDISYANDSGCQEERRNGAFEVASKEEIRTDLSAIPVSHSLEDHSLIDASTVALLNKNVIQMDVDMYEAECNSSSHLVLNTENHELSEFCQDETTETFESDSSMTEVTKLDDANEPSVLKKSGDEPSSSRAQSELHKTTSSSRLVSFTSEFVSCKDDSLDKDYENINDEVTGRNPEASKTEAVSEKLKQVCIKDDNLLSDSLVSEVLDSDLKCEDDLNEGDSNGLESADCNEIDCRENKSFVEGNKCSSEMKYEKLETESNLVSSLSDNIEILIDDCKNETTREKVIVTTDENKRMLPGSNEKGRSTPSGRKMKIRKSCKKGKQNIDVANQVRAKEEKPEKRDDNSAEEKVLDEDDWEQKWNEEGECLNKESIKELENLTGMENPIVIKAERPEIDYFSFKPQSAEPDIGDLNHLVEMFDFSPDLKTTDLSLILQTAGLKDFDIKWVDDTHAIGIFGSPFQAQQAIKTSNFRLKIRPVTEGTKTTKLKANSFKDLLMPYKQRPETTASVARNLVASALGIRSNATKEQRATERQKIATAKERKRMQQKMQRDAWGD